MKEILYNALFMLAVFGMIAGSALILWVCFKIFQKGAVVVRTWLYQRRHRHIPFASDDEMARFIEFLSLSDDAGVGTGCIGQDKLWFYTVLSTNQSVVMVSPGSYYSTYFARLVTSKQYNSLVATLDKRREQLKALAVEKALATASPQG